MGDMSHISVKSINYSTNVPYIVNNDDNNDNDAGRRTHVDDYSSPVVYDQVNQK